MDREYLSHLRFADDMVIQNTMRELHHILRELAVENENQTNKSNTKVMI